MTISGHFDVLQPGGWFTGFVPSPSLWTQLDQQLSQAVNGDGGGTYAPSTQIVIGGSGIVCPDFTTWTVALGGTLSVSGNVLIGAGGGLACISAAVEFAGTTAVLMQGTSSLQFQSGTSALFSSGTSITMQNGSTLTGDLGCSWDMNGELAFSATSQLSGLSAGAGWFNTNGNGIVIFDATNPKFLNARTRTIAQPLILSAANPASPTYQSYNGSSFVDNNVSTNFLPMTKVINGATIDGFSIKVSVANAHTPISAGRVTLVRNSILTGLQTLVAFASVPNGSIGLITVSASGFGGVPGSVVDDTQYTYFLEVSPESGGGAQPLQWFSPTLSFVNITDLGQF